jgi:hypothetical protein
MQGHLSVQVHGEPLILTSRTGYLEACAAAAALVIDLDDELVVMASSLVSHWDGGGVEDLIRASNTLRT